MKFQYPAALCVFALALLVPSPASADPAGPTDFETSIVSVDVVGDQPEPAGLLDLFDVEILGGDSFVEMVVTTGTEIRVPGYRQEPYLWFQADGTVVQNDRSPTRWLNEDRYSDIELPPTADVDAEPLWVEVANDGSYAWHDHRAHWMNGDKPLGAEPGDTVVDDVVVLFVGEDATEVRVSVRSVLLEPPSPVPAIFGAAAGLLLSIAGWRWWSAGGRHPRNDGDKANGTGAALLGPALVVVIWSVLAAAVGLGTTFGLPGEAAPSLTIWALPAVGALAVTAGVVIRRRSLMVDSLSDLVLAAALLLAGVELVIWAVIRRSAVTSSLIPTELPMWLDRLTVAGSIPIGLLALGVGFMALTGKRRLATSSSDSPVAGRGPSVTGPAGLGSEL